MLSLLTTACTADPAPPTGEIRDCGSSVYGEMSPDWRAKATVVGPVAFVTWFSADPAWLDSISPRPDGRRFIKVLAVVDGGKQVTISLPDSEPSNVALAYTDHDAPSVTFIGCERETQFNGGFMITGPQCVPVQVHFDGKTERIVLSFGAGKCAT